MTRRPSVFLSYPYGGNLFGHFSSLANPKRPSRVLSEISSFSSSPTEAMFRKLNLPIAVLLSKNSVALQSCTSQLCRVFSRLTRSKTLRHNLSSFHATTAERFPDFAFSSICLNFGRSVFLPDSASSTKTYFTFHPFWSQ